MLDGWVKGLAYIVYRFGADRFNPCCVGWVGKRAAAAASVASTKRFNPCCVGWVGKRSCIYIDRETMTRFNPCYVGWVGKSSF